MKQIKYILLFLIIIFAAVLRFYKLAEVPPAIDWDEAAVGYNAWTILHWGKDEWGNKFPLVFKSFEDYKNPVHIYLTVPFIAIFGLNELGVRAGSAFFGLANVTLIYFLAKKIFRNTWVGIFASLFLAISPYNLQFSRFNHELNFAIFFFMLGLYLVLAGIEKKNYLIILGFASLGLDLISYHSAKVIVPPVTLLLIILYLKELMKAKKLFLAGLAFFLLFVLLIFAKPELLGGARFKQTSSSEERKITVILQKYLKHYSFDFLFIRGDPSARQSAQTGTFYKTDAPFLAIGALALLFGILKDRKKEYFIVAIWTLLAPFPATLSSEIPHAARAMFLTGSLHMISAYGAYTFLSLFKNRWLKLSILIVGFTLLANEFYQYLTNYYKVYSTRYAIEWQYGMKQIASYVVKHPEYYRVYMTDAFSQPYIFFLFYTKTPLPEFLSSVKYNETRSRPSNLVASFGRYKFGLWDEIESFPSPGILYVVNPSKYNGLRFRTSFNLVNKVTYPNGTDAFFLVTSHEY